jgi:hypothetical protein
MRCKPRKHWQNNRSNSPKEATSYFGRTAAWVGEDMEDLTIQGANFVRNTVRDQPLQFLLITLGLGAIIGAFVSRR